MKKLKRSSNKKLFGIAAGVAEYLNIDPTVIRVLWACSILFGGLGFFAYIICIFVIPEN